MTHLKISLLGPPALWLGAQPAPAFVYNKARALLFYLAVEADRPHSRDALVNLLWPELPDTAARTNLRQALADLRRVLGEESPIRPLLLISQDSIQFNAGCDHDLDIVQFTRLLAACDAHKHRHVSRCALCATRLAQAVETYRGEFLSGVHIGGAAPFEEWVLLKRESLHQQVNSALARLTEFYTRRNDYEQAIRYARHQLELDSWQEEVHQVLMQLYTASGQRSAALAQYEQCKRSLKQGLGVEPSPETRRLYAALRAGQLASAHPDRPSDAIVPLSFTGQPLGSPAVAYELPSLSTPLLGRERELADLGEWLADPAHRLITVFGPGGIGKTHMALAAAAGQALAFRDGAAFVPLAAITQAEFLAPAILAALHQPLQSRQTSLEQLRRYLRDKELLLVLDNYEQILPDVDLLIDLLHYAPGVTLLVTSRERLGAPAEWLYPLGGLGYPAGKWKGSVESFAAIQLFVQRLRQFQLDFTLTNAAADTIARIAQLVEGMPLALELAAATTRELPLDRIADALEQGRWLKPARLRGLPERHLSVWRAFEQSWQLLSAPERHTFAHLSVFRGGFAGEAAQQIADATPTLLAALVDKSLLQNPYAGRYELHELLRHYAAEKLDTAGQTEEAQRRHNTYFLTFAVRAEAHLSGAQQHHWLEQMELDHDNLRAALNHALTTDPSLALTLTMALAPFWRRRGNVAEGRHWMQAVLAHITLADPAYAKALMWAGAFARLQGDRATALAQLEESLHLFRERQNEDGAAHTLRELGWVYSSRDEALALQLFEESLSIFRKLGDLLSVAQLLTEMAHLAGSYLGDYSLAKQYLQESLPLHQDVDDLHGASYALLALAGVADLEGDYIKSDALYQEALQMLQIMGAKADMGVALYSLAEAVWHRGDYERAYAYAQHSYQLHQENRIQGRGLAIVFHHLGLIEHFLHQQVEATAYLTESLRLCYAEQHTELAARCLAGLGGIAAYQGQASHAIYLLGAAYAHFAKDPPVLAPADWLAYEQFIEAARARLDDATFAALWVEGQATTLERVIVDVLAKE